MDIPGLNDELNILEHAPDQQFRTIEMTINGVTKKIVIPVTAGSNICMPVPPPPPQQSSYKQPKQTYPVPIKIEPEDDNNSDICEISDVTSLQPFIPSVVPVNEQSEREKRTDENGKPARKPGGLQHVPNILARNQMENGQSSQKPATSIQSRPFGFSAAQPISIRPLPEPSNETTTTTVTTSSMTTSQSLPMPNQLLDQQLLQTIVQTLADKNILHAQTKLLVNGDGVKVVNNAPNVTVPRSAQTGFQIVAQNGPATSRVHLSAFSGGAMTNPAPVTSPFIQQTVTTKAVPGPTFTFTRPPVVGNHNPLLRPQSVPLVISNNCSVNVGQIIKPLVMPSTHLASPASVKPAVVNQPPIAQIMNGSVMVPSVTTVNTGSRSTMAPVRPVYMIPLGNQKMPTPVVAPVKTVSAGSTLQPIHMMQMPSGKLQVIQPGLVNTVMNQSNGSDLQTTCLQATKNVDGSVVFKEVKTPATVTKPNPVPLLGPLSANPGNASICMKATMDDKRQIILNGHSLGAVVERDTEKKEKAALYGHFLQQPRIPRRPRPRVRSFNPQKILNTLPPIAPKASKSSAILENLAEAIAGYEINKHQQKPGNIPKVVDTESNSVESGSYTDGTVSDSSEYVSPTRTGSTKTLDERWDEVLKGTPRTRRANKSPSTSTKQCSVTLRRLDMRGRQSVNVHDVLFEVPTKPRSAKIKYDMISDVSESSQSEDESEEDDYFVALKKERMRKRLRAQKLRQKEHNKRARIMNEDEVVHYH